MTEEQRAYLRHRLEQEHERVVGYLARFGERVVEADRRADDDSDAQIRATYDTDRYNQALDALEISRLSGALADIRDALKLLDETPDRYGLDERTGEPIPFRHLERVPWARTVEPHKDATDLLAADADVLSAYRNERYSG